MQNSKFLSDWRTYKRWLILGPSCRQKWPAPHFRVIFGVFGLTIMGLNRWNIPCVCICSVYMVPSSVSPPPPLPPPPHGLGPQVAATIPFYLQANWQHFWGPASYLLGLCSISDYPASHLLGTCYLLGDLRSTHTPSKYLRATYSHIYMCYASTVSTSYLLPVYSDNTTCV